MISKINSNCFGLSSTLDARTTAGGGEARGHSASLVEQGRGAGLARLELGKVVRLQR
jgi:hypothetical protein